MDVEEGRMKIQEEGEEAIKEILSKMKKYRVPTGVGEWCTETLASIDSEMNARRIVVHWEEVEQENNRVDLRSNALQEEAIYLRTRKRTMAAVMSDIDMEEESNKEARVDDEESSDHEIGILVSQSSSESFFSVESEDFEVVKYRRYVFCYDELTGSKFDTFFRSLTVKKFDSGLLCFEDVFDGPSVIYKNTDRTLFETITVDFTVMYKETEVVPVEVKPYNTQESLVELDKVRIAEVSKKRLHKRMVTSKTVKEFSTFGATAVGDDVELYQLKFDDGKYNHYKVGCFTLPTISSTYPFLPVALDALISFKELTKSTLVGQEEKNMPYMMNVTRKMKKTTLYLLQKKM